MSKVIESAESAQRKRLEEERCRERERLCHLISSGQLLRAGDYGELKDDQDYHQALRESLECWAGSVLLNDVPSFSVAEVCGIKAPPDGSSEKVKVLDGLPQLPINDLREAASVKFHGEDAMLSVASASQLKFLPTASNKINIKQDLKDLECLSLSVNLSNSDQRLNVRFNDVKYLVIYCSGLDEGSEKAFMQIAAADWGRLSSPNMGWPHLAFSSSAFPDGIDLFSAPLRRFHNRFLSFDMQRVLQSQPEESADDKLTLSVRVGKEYVDGLIGHLQDSLRVNCLLLWNRVFQALDLGATYQLKRPKKTKGYPLILELWDRESNKYHKDRRWNPLAAPETLFHLLSVKDSKDYMIEFANNDKRNLTTKILWQTDLEPSIQKYFDEFAEINCEVMNNSKLRLDTIDDICLVPLMPLSLPIPESATYEAAHWLLRGPAAFPWQRIISEHDLRSAIVQMAPPPLSDLLDTTSADAISIDNCVEAFDCKENISSRIKLRPATRVTLYLKPKSSRRKQQKQLDSLEPYRRWLQVTLQKHCIMGINLKLYLAWRVQS